MTALDETRSLLVSTVMGMPGKFKLSNLEVIYVNSELECQLLKILFNVSYFINVNKFDLIVKCYQ